MKAMTLWAAAAAVAVAVALAAPLAGQDRPPRRPLHRFLAGPYSISWASMPAI
jgi:hypothetical protein